MLEIWDVVFIIYVNIVGGGDGRKDLQILGKNTKNLLQEFQSKGTKLSTVLGVLLLHLLALWVEQWLVSFDKKFYGKRTAESEKATGLYDPALRAWAALGSTKEDQSSLGFPLSPGKKAGLGEVAIGSTHIWNDLYFSPFQHG